MEACAEDLLPGERFHVVFTLPAEIARIAYWNQKAVHGLLFRASAKTAMTIAADPKRRGAKAGMTGVLHIWGAALTHLHMIVPGGGLSPNGTRRVACKPGVFLHVRVLARVFRRLCLDGPVDLHRAGQLTFFGDLDRLEQAEAIGADGGAQFRETEWVIYAKPPFGEPEAVLAYLSRYTHRAAISNQCLISADADAVAFRWKDYRIERGDRRKVMRLAAPEFIRRFPIHALPDGFHPIRHYGLLASSARKTNIAKIRNLPGAEPSRQEPQADAEIIPHALREPCPCCGGPMRIVETFRRAHRPPPAERGGRSRKMVRLSSRDLGGTKDNPRPGNPRSYVRSAGQNSRDRQSWAKPGAPASFSPSAQAHGYSLRVAEPFSVLKSSYSCGSWQTASILCPSGSRTNAP